MSKIKPPRSKTNAVSFMLKYLLKRIFRFGAPASLKEAGLFTGAPQHQNMCRIDELVPVTHMPASSKPRAWPEGPKIEVPETYLFEGTECSTEKLLEDTDTAALLVLVDGEVRYERYLLTGGPKVNWLSWSVAKSFTSALVGIAVSEGHIKSIEEPISDYVPVKPGSGYDGVSIKAVLQMSSGTRFTEDYNDPDSDIFKLSQAMLGSSGGLNGFIANMSKESEPDTVCRYNSGDTQMLGALVACATGRPIADYMTEKLIEPLGFETPSYWMTDVFGTEMCYGGLCLTARDFARIGELYRNKGEWNGQQILDADWVKASTTIDSPVREPGNPLVGDHEIDLGYGYQFWIPAGNKGDYSAVGVLNQLVYVNPEKKVTIVKLSANRHYGTTHDEALDKNIENIEFLRAIAEAV